MSRDRDGFDEPDEDWRDFEYPDEDDFDDGELETEPCPRCGRAIPEDAVRCPYCGDYVTAEGGSVWSGRPLWWIVLAVLGTIATIAALASL